MNKLELTRRQALIAAAAAGVTYMVGTRKAEAFTAPAKLVDAAKKEGKMVIYTASFIEVMQEDIKAFQKIYPWAQIEMVRLPGGQLITRVQTEAAAGKLAADVVDHSDPALMKRHEALFQDYAPPNAKDFIPSALLSHKLWPTIAPCWAIASHAELVKNPPKSWADLTKQEYNNGLIGQVIGPSGGTTLTRIMFERMVMGENYWKNQAATKPRLYPSGAPLSDALVRGEVGIAPLLYNIIMPKQRDGAPVNIYFGPEGVPVCPYASGIPKTAKSPNLARLFLDWFLSPEGQAHSIAVNGNFTVLKNAPATPKGFDAKTMKVWVPDFAKSGEVAEKWLAEWNQTYGNRQ